MAHTCKASTEEAEGEGLQVPGLPGPNTAEYSAGLSAVKPWKRPITWVPLMQENHGSW